MQESIATLTSPSNRMTVDYISQVSSSSNVAFSASYWSTFLHQAPTVQSTTHVPDYEDDDYASDYEEGYAPSGG